MNRTAIVIVSALLFSFNLQAQHIPTSKVPTSVIKSFRSRFPGVIHVKWEIENKTDYEASFTKKDKKLCALFSRGGAWKQTEKEIRVSALPEAVATAIARDFTGCFIEEATQAESAQYGKGYEVELKKGEDEFCVFYSAEGKMLSKIKKDKNDDEEDD